MKAETFNRLHSLRMRNTATGYEMDEMRGRFAGLANRHENGTAPRAVVAHQLFQTSAKHARQLVELVNPQEGERILEPSAGLGRLLDAIQERGRLDVMAVEMAASCASELYAQNREGVTLKQCDFLTLETYDTGLFDCVIMNPPFTMRSDIRHINHALTFLKKGGRLGAICFDTEHRRKAYKGAQWIPLPADAFKEAGTSVQTAIILITND